MDSAIYKGQVFHARHTPKHHAFSYDIFLFWLNLEELQHISERVRGFSTHKWAPVHFKRTDYLGDPTTPLDQAVIARMSELAGEPLSGTPFMLGQVRTFGMYFSPVNFYYLRQSDGFYSHLLAEVSNTPWNERHHYLVDLKEQKDAQKEFHVSPFNPMDMLYHWKIKQPNQKLKLSMSCSSGKRHFDAALNLDKIELNSNSLLRVLVSIPSMTIKTVFGIYWQALKLYLKGVPFYGHPSDKEKDKQW